MKKTAISFMLGVGLGLSALSMSASALDYGTLRPRSTVDSTGVPSLSGIPPTPIGPPQVGGGYGKSWTSYFLGQSKDGRTINYDGSIADEPYSFGFGMTKANGSMLVVWPAPQGASPVHVPTDYYCNGNNPVLFGGYVIVPLFTQDALMNGGPPYDWTATPDFIISPPSPGACSYG